MEDAFNPGQAAERLRLEKEKLDKIAACAPGVICSFHQSLTGHTSMPYASKATLEVYGLEPEDIADDMTPIFSRVPEDDLAHIIATITRSAETMDIWKDEFRYLHPVKGMVWLEGHSMPVREADGSLTWHGFIADITERKRAEEDVKRNADILRLFVEHAPAAVAMFDRDMRYVVTSHRYLTDYRLTEQELAGRSHYEVFPEMDEARKDIHRRCLDGEVVQCDEDPLPRVDGTIDYVRYELRPWYESEGIIGGLIFFSEVITERKHAEIVLRESEAKYRDLINNMNDSIFVLDYDTTILDVNTTASAVLGYSREELLAMNILEIDVNLRPEQIVNLAESMPADKTQLFVTAHRTKDGRIIPVEVSSSLVSYGGRTVIMSISRDITERKSVEEELRKAKEKAEESDRLKSAFLSNMSHEIRTPMNAILGFASLLKRASLTEAHRAEFVEIINQSGKRMLNTINDLIEISSIEMGGVSLQESETNLTDMLQFLFNLFELQAGQKGLHFSFTTPAAGGKPIVITDKNKLERVLINLIGNAMKFTKLGSITFGYEQKGEVLEFYVSDTGMGIPADRLDAIFERFVQADLSMTRPYEGSGLGLAISREYVTILGGRLWVESTQNAGSTFRFTIPIKTGEAVHPVQSNTPAGGKKHLLRDKTVLIAEDDDVNFLYLKNILEPLCNKVIRAVNGKEAVDLCRAGRNVHFILMDIKMGVMDGYEATRRIRDFDQNVIIIAQTAHALRGELENALEAGCDDYLPKPFNGEDLVEMMTRNL